MISPFFRLNYVVCTEWDDISNLQSSCLSKIRPLFRNMLIHIVTEYTLIAIKSMMYNWYTKISLVMTVTYPVGIKSSAICSTLRHKLTQVHSEWLCIKFSSIHAWMYVLNIHRSLVEENFVYGFDASRLVKQEYHWSHRSLTSRENVSECFSLNFWPAEQFPHPWIFDFN